MKKLDEEDGRYEMENKEKIDLLWESEVQVFALNLDGTENASYGTKLRF